MLSGKRTAPRRPRRRKVGSEAKVTTTGLEYGMEWGSNRCVHVEPGLFGEEFCVSRVRNRIPIVHDQEPILARRTMVLLSCFGTRTEIYKIILSNVFYFYLHLHSFELPLWELNVYTYGIIGEPKLGSMVTKCRSISCLVDNTPLHERM